MNAVYARFADTAHKVLCHICHTQDLCENNSRDGSDDEHPEDGLSHLGLLEYDGAQQESQCILAPHKPYHRQVLDLEPENGKISDESPVGEALLNRNEGDEVVVKLPNGAQVKFTVLEVIN